MKPLLTLCMMVRNEAHGIARTLRSAKPFVDRWCILDTGSTDGTPEILYREMEGVPGFCMVVPFVDFATTRNRLLGTARTRNEHGQTEFLLLLDADDILEDGRDLRTALMDAMPLRPETRAIASSINPAVDAEAFYLPMREGTCEWQSARVVRADAVGPDGWRYVGAVHEVLCKEGAPPPSIVLPGRIVHDPPPRSVEARRARLERDAELLLPGAEKGEPRATFYLAETLRRLGDMEGASYWYMQRTCLGGWVEEVFMSRLWFARTREGCEWVAELLMAHATDPRRAEPLYEIARRYLNVAVANRGTDGASWTRQPEDALAFLFARRAWELPKPQGALFVDAEVYEWQAADVLAQAAWWLGEYEIGERAARQAVEKGPPDGAEQRARNLGFYLERKAAR